MGAKHQRIDIRVDDQQVAFIKDKADKYGITVSELLIRATEAYARVFDADARGAALVAINYGVWMHTMRRLLDVEQVMRECVRQLTGIRHMQSGLSREGEVTLDDFARVEAMLAASCSEIREDLRHARRAFDALESLKEAACVTDFCLCVEPETGVSLRGRD